MSSRITALGNHSPCSGDAQKPSAFKPCLIFLVVRMFIREQNQPNPHKHFTSESACIIHRSYITISHYILIRENTICVDDSNI